MFFDYGGAYSQIDPNKPFAQFHGGIGAELWLDAITSYFIQSNLRLGVAHGLDHDSPGYQTYAVIVSGF